MMKPGHRARYSVVCAALVSTALVAPAYAQPLNPLDQLEVLNRLTCYPFGVDQIGRGDVSGGIDTWKSCFTPDFRFSLYMGFGERTDCPGEKCSLSGDTSIEKRAAFARRIYDNAGYVRTSHHLTNQTVSFPENDKAHVKSYLQAWHFKADGSAVIGVGEWVVDLVRSPNGWLISQENLTITGAGGLQSLKR